MTNDTHGNERVSGSTALNLGICTFGILALELGLIRWISGQIRIVAYFSNLILLKSAKDSASALGSNLLGAVCGGVLEYGSMYFGLKAVALLALCFYLLALRFLLKGRAAETSPAANT